MRRIDKDMNLYEMINNITNDDYIKNVLVDNIDYPRLDISLLTLDYYGIVDDYLSYFYLFACNNDTKKFFYTITIFRLGIFSKEEILNNLESDNIIPFIDDTITVDEKDRYHYRFDYYKWRKYLYSLKESFNNRRNILIKELK